LKHSYFDNNFKSDFEKNFGDSSLTPKKPKSKIILTPEPTSYMRIYARKKSPKYAMPSKHSNDSIKLKKNSPVANKSNEKSYFFPDIIKKDEIFKRKKSSKHLNKVLEIRTDAKSTLKSPDLNPGNDRSRNQSLAHDSSNENFVKISFVSPTLSNRHQNFTRKEVSPFNPEQLPNISFLPNKYRLKKYENIKNNIKFIAASINEYSPSHK
jgi:hypothetical protein